MKTAFQYDSAGAWIEKDPTDDLDYWNDWTDELAATGATAIATSTWSVTTGVTSHDTAISGLLTRTFLSGGTAGTTYTINNTMVDNATPPRTYQRSFRLIVREQ